MLTRASDGSFAWLSFFFFCYVRSTRRALCFSALVGRACALAQHLHRHVAGFPAFASLQPTRGLALRGPPQPFPPVTTGRPLGFPFLFSPFPPLAQRHRVHYRAVVHRYVAAVLHARHPSHGLARATDHITTTTTTRLTDLHRLGPHSGMGAMNSETRIRVYVDGETPQNVSLDFNLYFAHSVRRAVAVAARPACRSAAPPHPPPDPRLLLPAATQHRSAQTTRPRRPTRPGAPSASRTRQTAASTTRSASPLAGTCASPPSTRQAAPFGGF